MSVPFRCSYLFVFVRMHVYIYIRYLVKPLIELAIKFAGKTEFLWTIGRKLEATFPPKEKISSINRGPFGIYSIENTITIKLKNSFFFFFLFFALETFVFSIDEFFSSFVFSAFYGCGGFFIRNYFVQGTFFF